MHAFQSSKVTKVVVATTVMLAFISFWRAAAILLCDLASSAYYAGGLAMYVVGPLPLRLLFHGFVVVVGTILLSGAVNTAIIGSNGVLNRIAEDGVLPDWFRGHKLHHRDVVRIALKRLEADLRSRQLHEVLSAIRKERSDEEPINKFRSLQAITPDRSAEP